MSEVLKECPFCGAELFEGKNVHHKSVMRHPYNTDCPLSEASWLNTAGFHDIWNRRTQPDKPPLNCDGCVHNGYSMSGKYLGGKICKCYACRRNPYTADNYAHKLEVVTNEKM
jgi:hypothetical protein